MQWTETYRRRVTTAERADEAIRSGQGVWIHIGCANPEELVRAMVARAGELRDVTVSHLLTLLRRARRPEVRGVLPPPCALRGRERARRCQRRPRGLRARLPEAPYFHDGSAKTLMDVVNHYEKGGVVTTNLSPSMKPLTLSKQDKEDLVAFMQALTGTTPAITIPALPQ